MRMEYFRKSQALRNANWANPPGSSGLSDWGAVHFGKAQSDPGFTVSQIKCGPKDSRLFEWSEPMRHLNIYLSVSCWTQA
ncbi:MAG: hypothetical protein ACO3A2_01550 [Bdellovibrionia bacterium]